MKKEVEFPIMYEWYQGKPLNIDRMDIHETARFAQRFGIDSDKANARRQVFDKIPPT